MCSALIGHYSAVIQKLFLHTKGMIMIIKKKQLLFRFVDFY